MCESRKQLVQFIKILHEDYSKKLDTLLTLIPQELNKQDTLNLANWITEYKNDIQTTTQTLDDLIDQLNNNTTELKEEYLKSREFRDNIKSNLFGVLDFLGKVKS